MSHAFHISDDTYHTLEAIAAARGQSPDALFQDWLVSLGAAAAPAEEADPLAPFIGAFEATVPDLVQRHDHYLAQAAAERHDRHG